MHTLTEVGNPPLFANSFTLIFALDWSLNSYTRARARLDYVQSSAVLVTTTAAVTVDLLGEALIEVVLAAGVKIFLLGGLFDAVPDRLQDDGDSSIEGGHVGFPEDRYDRVGGHGFAELLRERFGAVVEEQERFQGG